MIRHGQDADYATVRRACAARIRQHYAALSDEELAEWFNQMMAEALNRGERSSIGVTTTLFYVTRELENRTRGMLEKPEKPNA